MSTKRTVVIVLAIEALLILSFGVFIFVFDLSKYSLFLSFNSGLVIASAIGFLALCIGEFLSLRFDRTATKNTLFAALMILGCHIFSYDFMTMLHRGGTPNIIVFEPYIVPLLEHLCFMFFTFFIFRFYQHDYHAPKVALEMLVVLSFNFVAKTLFYFFNLELSNLLVSILESGFVLIMAIMVVYRIRLENNYITALFTLGIIVMVVLSYLANSLCYLTFIPKLVGVGSLSFLLCASFFVLIYITFAVNKTKMLYEYEDDLKAKEQSGNKIKVTCFKTFECFIQDKPIEFPAKKSKEFFALLVALNGKSLSMDKAITYLWPDKDLDKAKVSYRDVIWKLRKLFDSIHFYGVTFKRGVTFLDKKDLECDFYDLLQQKKEIDMEDFMPEYDWSLGFEINY